VVVKDQAVENGLKVWGSYYGRPRQFASY